MPKTQPKAAAVSSCAGRNASLSHALLCFLKSKKLRKAISIRIVIAIVIVISILNFL